MIKRGWLGEKTGSGFYKRVKKGGDSEILTLDWQKMEYRPRQKAKFGSIEAGKQIEETRERIRALVGPGMEGKGDKANRFLWSCLSEICLYAARRVPEIANSVVDVDRAMRWGFAWELGPFEIWDAIGVERMAEALGREGKQIPPVVNDVLASPKKSFYETEKGATRYFDIGAKAMKPVPEPAGIIILKVAERSQRRGADEFRREPDRSWRRRGVLRISLQDECDRRRHRRDDSRGSEAAWNRNSKRW